MNRELLQESNTTDYCPLLLCINREMITLIYRNAIKEAKKLWKIFEITTLQNILIYTLTTLKFNSFFGVSISKG